MTTTDISPIVVPDEIARQIVLPEGHRDDDAVFKAYEWLRANAPLAQVKVDGYDAVWLVTKHADIMEIEKQPHLFSNGGGANPGTNNPNFGSQADDEFSKNLTGGSVNIIEALSQLDPPDHTVVRDIATEWFRPIELKKWEDRIRVLAKEAISARLTEGTNEMDFVKDFTVYYPLHVIMTLFGVSAEDEPLMMSLTQGLFSRSADKEAQAAEAEPISLDAAGRQFAEAVQKFYDYFDVLVEACRAEPKDNIASIIANSRTAEGEFFSKEICYGWYIAIATAGHDTTSSTMASCLEALAQNPDQLTALQADPSGIPSLVNESLRWASPVKQFTRMAAEDYVLRGQQIKAGDRLMTLYQSANRDEDVFDQPNEFHYDRKPNKHIAFGYGPHMCIGQHLAKMEMRVMLEELLPRIQSLELTEERKVVPTNWVGGLQNLPIKIVLR